MWLFLQLLEAPLLAGFDISVVPDTIDGVIDFSLDRHASPFVGKKVQALIYIQHVLRGIGLLFVYFASLPRIEVACVLRTLAEL